MQTIDLLSSLSRDIIDMDSVLETIRDNHVHGFQSLYDIQVSKMGIRQIDIPLKDFKIANRLVNETFSRNFPIRYAYHTDINLVETEQELAFKKDGEFYNKSLTLDDISKERRFFRSNIIPMLDNKLLYNINVIVTEDNSTLVITLDEEPEKPDSTGISKQQFLDYMNNDEVLHVFVVPNYHMELVKIDRNKIGTDRVIPASQFEEFKEVVSGSTFSFLSRNNESISDLSFIRTTIDNSGVVIPENVFTGVTLDTLILVTMSFDDIYTVTRVTKDNEWIMLDNSFELPLPKRNILPFVLSDNIFTINNSITIDQYYPNIYHVNNVDDKEIMLFNFYRDDTLDSRYRNALQSLRLVYDDILSLYETNSIPDIIKDFEPVEIPLISEPLFKETIYYPNRKNEFIVNHLNDYINKDPDILVRYLYLKLKNTTKFFIDVNKVDLNKRQRMSTINDIGEIGEIVYFDEPYYMLNVRKSFIGSPETEFRIFIDNLAIDRHDVVTTYNKDFFLIYIKASLVKSNSMIEIERFVQHLNDVRDIGVVESIDSGVDTHVNDMEAIFDLFPGIKTKPIRVKYTDNLDSIMAYNIDIMDNLVFLTNDEFKLFIYNDVVDQIINIEPDGNYIIDRDFYVVPTDKFIGKSLQINFSTGYTTECTHIKKTSNVFNDTITPQRRVRQNDVRIFKNGLNMPGERFRVIENESCDESINVILSSEMTPGDVVDVDICPFAFKEEFRLDQIDDRGYVDTGDALSYPLDLKWYDIYLNGYRLNKSNLEIISCNRFFIKNVDSLKNLRILKRLDINGVFSTNHDNDATNIIIDNIPDFIDKLKEDKDIIQDTAEDIIGDVISDIFEHLDFVERYLEFIFINPNEQQLNHSIKMEYPELFNEYDILTLITESTGITYVTSIDSNIRRKYMKRNQYRYGFTPLHVGNHEDAMLGEYMCDPITGSPAMKTDDGGIIASGMLSRLTMHKNRVNNQLMVNNFTSVSIYHLDRNSNLLTQEYTPNQNMLDEDVDINVPFNRMMISFDMDVLERGAADIMHISSYDPTIRIVYSTADGGDNIEMIRKLSEFNDNVLTVNSDDMTIKSISIQSDPSAPSTVRFILYSILLAF